MASTDLFLHSDPSETGWYAMQRYMGENENRRPMQLMPTLPLGDTATETKSSSGFHWLVFGGMMAMAALLFMYALSPENRFPDPADWPAPSPQKGKKRKKR